MSAVSAVAPAAAAAAALMAAKAAASRQEHRGFGHVGKELADARVR